MFDRLRLLGALAVFSMTLMAWSIGTGVPAYAHEHCEPGDFDEFCEGPSMCGGVPPEEQGECEEFCKCYHDCICEIGEHYAPFCAAYECQ